MKRFKVQVSKKERGPYGLGTEKLMWLQSTGRYFATTPSFKAATIFNATTDGRSRLPCKGDKLGEYEVTQVIYVEHPWLFSD